MIVLLLRRLDPLSIAVKETYPMPEKTPRIAIITKSSINVTPLDE